MNGDLVSNLDFAETFLEAAGVAVPAEMQGRSLVPLLAGQTPADWRKSFYYHYYEYPGPHSVARHYGVVTDRYKLVHFYEPSATTGSCSTCRRTRWRCGASTARPDYAAVQKELQPELERFAAS